MPVGNQLLSSMFGAQLHFTGAAESAWGELEIAREALTDELPAAGAAPYAIPIGGSTAVGALGYAAAFVELMEQCEQQGIGPAAIVHTSSSGGTHAGLVAGRALARARGHAVPDVLAIGVAKGVNLGLPDIVELAGDALELAGADARARRSTDDVEIDTGWIGDDYAIPTAAGDAAIRWAARHGGWVLDRVVQRQGHGRPARQRRRAVAGRRAATSCSSTPAARPAIFAPDGVPSVSISVRRMSEILDVDLLAFESSTGERRRAVVDGVARSLATGFVYTRHDLSEDLLDTAYAMLREFFALEPDVKQQFVGAGRTRADRLHRPARRDRGVERQARLEGDAQLGVADPRRPSAQAQVPSRLSRPGAARVGGARHHRRCCTSSTTRSPTCSAASCA